MLFMFCVSRSRASANKSDQSVGCNGSRFSSISGTNAEHADAVRCHFSYAVSDIRAATNADRLQSVRNASVSELYVHIFHIVDGIRMKL